MSDAEADAAVLRGSVAVVTGAGRGLGRSHALTLAAAGASVVVNDPGTAVDGQGSDAAVAGAVVDEIAAAGGTAIVDTTAVSSIAAGVALVERARRHLGRVDIVVNNAGISGASTVADLDDDRLAAYLGVHLAGAIGTTQALFRQAAADGRGGAVVNTTSGAGLAPAYAGALAYGTAKAGVYALTRSAAIEGAPLGVRVNAISPLARTRMSEAYFPAPEPGADDPLDPARVSEVVVFLVSDASRDLTGRVLRIGGREICEVSFATTEPTSASGPRWTLTELTQRQVDYLRPDAPTGL